jgi:hypothetical protein
VPDRPVALGYQSLRLDSSDDAQEIGRRVLAAFAELQGYLLRGVYTEHAYAGRLPAFELLLSRVAREQVAAVIVPSLDDFGHTPRVRQAMQLRLGQMASLRILVVAR